MADNTGKVILSLLAGATAGIVAGLMLAPETGEDTRSSFKKAAGDLGNDLSKFFQDTVDKARTALNTTDSAANEEASVSEDRTAADNLFNSMSTSGGASQAEAGNTGDVHAQGDNATTAGL